LAHTLVQLAQALDTTLDDLLPEETAPAQQPELRSRVQSELLEKVGVPRETSERLAQKLLEQPGSFRRKREHTTGKKRR
jgi:hypothetical protein